MNETAVSPIERVSATQAACELIEELKRTHGPIMFHLSGGCCDGSAPMCFKVGEFKLGGVDEKVGDIVGCEFWMDRERLRRWGGVTPAGAWTWCRDAAPVSRSRRRSTSAF